MDEMNELFGDITEPTEEVKTETAAPAEQEDETSAEETSETQEDTASAADTECDDDDDDGDSLPAATETPTELKAKTARFCAKDETMEEMTLRYLLVEREPGILEKALAEGKTIRGAWKFVFSVVRASYIANHGRKNGGFVGSPEMVLSLAVRYLAELPEGTEEPEPSYTPKKAKGANAPVGTNSKPSTAKVIENVAKKAAKTAKKAADGDADLFSFFNM